MKERDVVAAIVRELRARGAEVIKTHGDQFTVPGEPDLLACLEGRMVRIEVKQPGQHPTAAQYARLRAWEKAGALCGWCTSPGDAADLLAHFHDPSWKNPQLWERYTPIVLRD